jgi:single-stranded DNA-binding protein
LREGSDVYVEGRIKSREYEVDGKTRFSLDVSGSQVQFLGQSKSNDVVDEDEDRDHPILEQVTPYALNTTDGD